jgi:hypothetical protein
MAVDLAALTSEAATPMPGAAQRAPAPAPSETVGTANLQALAFKVTPAFRRRFRQRAADADMKLNELLFAALTAWEEKQNLPARQT